MSISIKVKEGIAASSWVVNIFEDRSQAGSWDKEMYDFRLGNRSIEPPLAFVEELRRVANNPFPEMHGYSPLAGHNQTREAIARHVKRKRTAFYCEACNYDCWQRRALEYYFERQF